MTTRLRTTRHRVLLWPRALAAAAIIGLAACGSSSSKTATGSPASTATSSGPAASSGAAAASGGSSATTPSSTGNAGVTVKAAMVPGVGTVLVNGDGRTLYLLTSEKGGKLTCTDGNGCTTYWPDTELPSGITHGVAGSGAQASLLSTVRSADGSLYLTYAGYPLYTYTGDSGAGQNHGQGVVSFGGTWWAISPSGAPVTASSYSGSATTMGSSGSGGGGSY